MDCTIRVAKTKALIKFAVTAKLICVFVFAYAKFRFLTTRLKFERVTMNQVFGFTDNSSWNGMDTEIVHLICTKN